MQEIHIKSVKDGMILAESLRNAHGNLILEQGTLLTEAFAARLARLGIFTVCVEGEQEEAKAETEAEETLTVEQIGEVEKIPLKKLFEGKLENSSMREIYDALIRHGA